jgi:hypothetical protein
MTAKTSKVATVIASLVFLALSGLFISLNYYSVINRVKEIAEVKQSMKLAKQGLKDIRKIQEAHDRKYKKLATSFPDLVKFAKYDSINVLVRAEGDLPERRMTIEEAKKLEYQYPQPWKESDVLKLGLSGYVREYKKLPVANDIFGKDTKENANRVYQFDVDKLDTQRTIDNKGKKFSFRTAVVDSTSTVLIQAIPPYGPQRPDDSKFNINDTLQIGDLKEKQIKTNWK